MWSNHPDRPTQTYYPVWEGSQPIDGGGLAEQQKPQDRFINEGQQKTSYFKKFSPLKPRHLASPHYNGNYVRGDIQLANQMHIDREEEGIEPVPSDSPNQKNSARASESPKKGRKVQKGAPSENNKVGVLEQENQQLKSQIETLRAALLDLCNDKNMPFQAITNQMLQAETKAFASQGPSSGIQTESPRRQMVTPETQRQKLKISPQKHLSFGTECKADGSVSSRMPSRSPKKSQSSDMTGGKPQRPGAPQRRRRSQRKGSMSKTPRRAVGVPESANLEQSAKAQSTAGQNCFDYRMTTPNARPQCEDSQQPLEHQQPQLTKILEEQLYHTRKSSGRGHNRTSSMEASLFKYPSMCSGGLLIGNSPSQHLVNVVSQSGSKFYEHQISNLKSELEIFEIEEQKIISLIISNNGQPHYQSQALQDESSILIYEQKGQSHFPTRQNSAVKKLTEEGYKVMENGKRGGSTKAFNLGHEQLDERSATELADQDMRVFEEIRAEELKDYLLTESDHPVLPHQEMLRNLQDVFSFIQSQPRYMGPREDERVIRPIKIVSPAVQSLDIPRPHLSRQQSAGDKIQHSPQRQQEYPQTRVHQLEQSVASSRNEAQVYPRRMTSLEGSTPQCSALCQQLILESSPTPETQQFRDTLPQAIPRHHPFAASIVKSNSWIGVTHQEDIPRFEIATKQREEPTPKVIPYEIDESTTTNGEAKEQLRVMSSHGKRSSIVEFAQSIVKNKAYVEQQSPEAEEVEVNELMPSEAQTRISQQNSEKKLAKKIDRSESIRRAEEMLSQFLHQGPTSKRPEFLRNRRGLNAPQAEQVFGGTTLDTKAQRFSFSPLLPEVHQQQPLEREAFDPETIHETEKISRMQQAINNISFQHAQQQYFEHGDHARAESWFSPQPIPESAAFKQTEKPVLPTTEQSSPEHQTSYLGDMINLEINPSKQKSGSYAKRSQRDEQPKITESHQFQVEMQTQNFKSFDEQFNRNSSVSPVQGDPPKYSQHDQRRPSHTIAKKDEQYLEPRIIKGSKQHTSRQEAFGKESLHTSFDSKVTQSGKKLPVGHKVQKASSADRQINSSRIRQTSAISFGHEQKEQIKNFIQIASDKALSHLAMRTPTTEIKSNPQRQQQKSPSSSFGSKQQKPFIQKLGSKPQSSSFNPEANSSLISNAMLLAKQLQCLQQPYADVYLQQARPEMKNEKATSNFASKRPKTAENSTHQTNVGQYTGGVNTEISSYRQSTIGTELLPKRETQPTYSEATPTTAKIQASRQRSNSGGRKQSGQVQDKIRPLRSNHLGDVSVCSNGSNGRMKPRESKAPTNNVSRSIASGKVYGKASVKEALSTEKRFQIQTENLAQDPKTIAIKTPKTQIKAGPNNSCNRRVTNDSQKKAGSHFVKQQPKSILSAGYPDVIDPSERSQELYERELASEDRSHGSKKPKVLVKPIGEVRSLAERQSRPGQQQIREYYQLKREHERQRQIMLQAAQDMNASGRLFQNQQFPSTAQKPAGQPKKSAPIKSSQHVARIDVSPVRDSQIPSYQKKSLAQVAKLPLEQHQCTQEFNGPAHTASTTTNSNGGHHTSSKRHCLNCDRLRSQGLSTKFCLDHSEAANFTSSARKAFNQDLGCHIIYIDEE